MEGKKTATCWAVRHGQLSYIGKRTIACDGFHRPRVILETTSLEMCRYCDVDAEWARAEGEGDLSLGFWRDTHRDFFQREGLFSPELALWCELFRAVEVLPNEC